MGLGECMTILPKALDLKETGQFSSSAVPKPHSTRF